MTKPISVGAWKSGRPVKAKNARNFAKSLRAAGVSCVNLMLNPGVQPWHLPKWQPSDLAAVTRVCQELGIEVWWVFWAVSKDKAINEQLAALDGLLAHATPDGIEYDAEESWRGNGKELAEPLIAGTRRAVGASDIGLAITSVPHLSGIQRDELALFEAGKRHGFTVEARPQAYSTYQKPKPGRDTHWSWPSFFRPGPIQRHALDQWRPMREWGLVDRIRMGLASWAQRHPKPHPQGAEAVVKALDTTIADGDIDAVCYWRWSAISSSKAIQRVLKRAAGQGIYTFEDTGTMRGANVRELQERLVAAQYQPGSVDGLLGPRTKAAAAQYYGDARYMPSDVFDARLVILIEEALPKPITAPWSEVP